MLKNELVASKGDKTRCLEKVRTGFLLNATNIKFERVGIKSINSVRLGHVNYKCQPANNLAGTTIKDGFIHQVFIVGGCHLVALIVMILVSNILY